MPFDIRLVDTAFLDKKRLQTDPIADNVIEQIIEQGYQEKINDVFLTLVRNQDYDPSHFSTLPEPIGKLIESYFLETSALPDWADPAKIEIAENVFSLLGPEIFMLLNVASLPLCYTCKKGAKVLYTTGRLNEHGGNIDPLARRLMETAQMVTNVLSPGGLSKTGNGIVTIQKVRLIHASIRCFLKDEKYNKAGWDVEELGEPINQEDLAGTLVSFAPIILSGLGNMNITLTPEQEEGYSHCWKVIGHMMGIVPELLPETYHEGWELAVKILKHQSAESEAGKALTESCIAFMQYMIPGNLFDSVPEYMIWYYLQDISKATGLDLASMIGAQNHGSLKNKIILTLAKFIGQEVDHLQDHSSIIRKVSSVFNKVLLNGFLKHYNGGKNIHFFIPPSLQKDWKIGSEEWKDRMQVSPSIFGNRLMWQQLKKEE